MFDVYNKLPVCHDISDGKLRTLDVILKDEVKFSTLLLEDAIQQGLIKCGYMLLSPIQKNALPLALTGTSIIAHAKSGTGKTLVFLLTALNTFLKTNPKTNCMCLIIAPTREIAKQIYDVCKNISYFIRDLKVEYFIGGTPLDLDFLKCKDCHIGIGAPGRIKHLINLEALKVQNLRLLVLDEVDALLSNKEFAIAEVVNFLPATRQTIVCTATFSDDIKQLLNPIAADMKYVTIAEGVDCSDISTVSNVLIGVKQYVAAYSSDSTATDVVQTRAKLMEILNCWEYDQCFIFVNFISLVKSVYNFLNHSGLSVSFVSSEQTQSARIATLNKIKLNESRILVTTDLAARGIDVHNVNLVINIGIPSPPDVYIHRMGRSGRYGSKGAVITLIHEQKELEEFQLILRAVISDPIDLHVLPNIINKETLENDVTIVKCSPKPDSTLKAKYSFQRNVKEACPSANSKSSKKKRKKKKPRNKAGVIACAVASGCSSSEDAVGSHVKGLSINEYDKLEKLVHEYVDRIKEDTSKIEFIKHDVLERFFKSDPVQPTLYFSDYRNLVTENCSESEAMINISQSSLPDELLSLARTVRLKNQSMDKAKFPLTIGQFFDLYDKREKIVSQHISDTSCQYVRDVLSKIYELVPLPPPTNNFHMIPKKATKRVSDIRSSICTSNLTDNSSNVTCTSNCVRKPNKRSRKDCFSHPVNIHPYAVYPNIPYRPSDLTDFGPNHDTTVPSGHGRTNALRMGEDLAHVPTQWTQREKPANEVQCPDCKYRFTINLNTERLAASPSVIQPLNIFSSGRRAQQIWQNQINFINLHVNSLPAFNQLL